MTNRTPVPRALTAEHGRKEAAGVVPRTRATRAERKGWTPGHRGSSRNDPDCPRADIGVTPPQVARLYNVTQR